MTSFDFIALAVLGCSAVVGMMRGFIRETLGLVAFAAAAVGAVWWGPLVQVSLEPFIDTGLLRLALAYAGVFFAILLLVGVFNAALATLIANTGLAPADRGLGLMFGVTRGLLILLVLMLAAGYTPLPAEPSWRQALLAAPLEQAIVALKGKLPEQAGRWVPYPYEPPLAIEAVRQPGMPGLEPTDRSGAKPESI